MAGRSGFLGGAFGYGNRFACGHVREEGCDLIVSAAIGPSKLPIRFGSPPEIVRVELG